MNPEDSQKEINALMQKLAENKGSFQSTSVSKNTSPQTRPAVSRTLQDNGDALRTHPLREKILISAFVLSVLLTITYFAFGGEEGGVTLPPGVTYIQEPGQPPRLSQPIYPKN